MSRKIYNTIFGKLTTFEDDKLYWMINFATIFYRSPVQRYICGVFLFVYIVAAFIFFVYVIRMKPPITLIGESLTFFFYSLYIVITYGNFIRNFEFVQKMINSLQDTRKLLNISKYSLLKQKMKRINSVFNIIHCISLCLYMAIIISFLSNVNSYDQFLPSVIKSVLFDSIFVKVGLYGFMVPHGTVFGCVPLYIASYFVMHFKYLMLCLNEDVEQFIKEDLENKSSDINNIQFQKHTRQQIIYICMRFVRIKGDVEAFNSFIKWRYVSLIFTGTLAFGGMMLSVLIKNGPQRTKYLEMVLCGILQFVTGSEIGHQLEIESENLLKKILEFKWYQWSNKNCQMLIMLLLQIQEPVVIKCFAFPTINRGLLLRVLRVVHGYIACFQSIKKK